VEKLTENSERSEEGFFANCSEWVEGFASLGGQDFPKNQRAFTAATKHGHLELLKKFQLDNVLLEKVQIAAAKGGQLEVLKWCNEFGEVSIWVSDKAVLKGHLDVAKWYLELKGNDFSSCGLTNKAVAEGHLEMVKWLFWLAKFEGGKYISDEWTCAAAAQGGHLEVLKFLRENNCRWNKWVCLAAAKQGHLELLKWAWQNGAPWDMKSCAACELRIADIAPPVGIAPIAYSGQLAILRFAIENGGTFHPNTCRIAAERGDLEILKWAREHGLHGMRKYE